MMTAPIVEGQSAQLSPLLAAVFAALDQAGISYTLLRGSEELFGGAIDGDVDLLVAAAQFGKLRRTLEQAGFVALARWGQAPHHFFIGYDESADSWIKLDVLTELAYGRPIPALRTDLAARSLEHRVRHGPAFVLAAEEEFLTLLLHCLLDKGRFEPKYRVRLAELAEAIHDHGAMGALAARYLPAQVSWEQIRQLVGNGTWEELVRLGSAVAGHLARRDPLGTRWRRAVTPPLRVLDRRTRAFRTRGLTVALLAPDGAGKTTLARSLGQAFYLPTRYIYMGTNPNSGSMTLPTTRLLARMGRRWRPLVRALSALNGIVEQGLRYRVGAYHRQRGRLVVFDRYASGSLIGAQDGPPHKQLQRWAMRLICPPPDIVVYLDAPAEVLYQRKQEHSPEQLDRQRQHYRHILAGVAGTAVVDAGREPEEVRRRVAALIWRRYALDMQKR
jgi:thymidylate kinase